MRAEDGLDWGGARFWSALCAVVLVAASMLAGPARAAAVTRADGAQLIVATPGDDPDASFQNPAFSPTGSELFFTKYLCGYDAGADGSCAENQGGQLLDESAAGGALTILYGTCPKPPEPLSCDDEPTNVNGLASWNRPSNRVAFAVSGNGVFAGDGDIATVLGNGTGLNRVTHATNASYLEPTFDPAGTTIAFEADQLNVDDVGNHASLMTVTPDPQGRKLGSGLSFLINGPKTDSDNRLPVWSPDGKLILFQRRTNLTDPNEPYNLFTINPITAAMTQLTGRRGQPTFGDNDDSDASWSPDGKWVLDSATYYNSAGEPNIWVVSADGTQLVRATNNLHEDGAPAMSPDGAWIDFESHVGSDGTVSQIWRISSPVRSDGSMQVFRPTTSSPVAASAPSAQNPCYVPNSNTLLFTEFTAGYNNPSGTGSAGLFSVAAAGGNPSTVVFHSGQSAVNLPGTCYSSATGRIAYSSDLVNTDNIWTSLPGARNDSEHQVTCLTAPTLHAEEPSWAPDGKTLTYELDDDNDVNRTTIWTIPANNNCAHPVAPTEIVPAPSGRCPGQKAPPPDNHEPNWSPNGKQIVFQSAATDSAETVNLWTVTPGGCGLTRVTNDTDSDTDPSWSPDSRSIVYSTDFEAPTGIANLFVVKAVAGGAKTRLTSQCFYDGAPSWSPDGRSVSFESWADPHSDTNDHPTSIWRIAASAHPTAPHC